MARGGWLRKYDEENKMKARNGERIVCDCGLDMGEFKTDVADENPISSEDFGIDGILEGGAYLCRVCKLEVAVLENSAWRLRKRKNWIQ